MSEIHCGGAYRQGKAYTNKKTKQEILYLDDCPHCNTSILIIGLQRYRGKVARLKFQALKSELKELKPSKESNTLSYLPLRFGKPSNKYTQIKAYCEGKNRSSKEKHTSVILNSGKVPQFKRTAYLIFLQMLFQKQGMAA